jgi:hypothetical protein
MLSGLCHHGLAGPLVVKREDAIQRLNKLSRTSHKMQPSRFGVTRGVNNPRTQKKTSCYKGVKHGQSLWNNTSYGWWTKDLTFGMWGVSEGHGHNVCYHNTRTRAFYLFVTGWRFSRTMLQRNLFGPNTERVAGERRKPFNEARHGLY